MSTLRLWPVNWFHVHADEKLLSMQAVDCSEQRPLAGNSTDILIGVRCLKPECTEPLRLIKPTGSFKFSYYGHGTPYDEVMDILREKAYGFSEREGR